MLVGGLHLEVSSMHQEIIDLLSYPRSLVLSQIGEEDCKKDAYFDPHDTDCTGCRHGQQCQWLFSNDGFIELSRKPVEDLVAALDFAISYVDHRFEDHNSRACACQSCQWLRAARRAMREVEWQHRRVSG